ncbi:hypothetical protein CYMTET_55252 [Cymbomonas tetramitiformis]|uniref:DEAD-box helicase OB fold domain-containing protein n=1 Tax=Cymbomonas tetramitiformis TaxID=36881 RepID=A0AAE0BDN4_9CHLO|nr:hypothetical protein CYMTET_55252 [Cymbomonas tetramitiformis]
MEHRKRDCPMEAAGGGGHRSRRVAQHELRKMQREMERDRGRRVLQVGEDGGVNEEGDSSDSDAEGKDGGKCGGQSEAAKLDFMRSKDLELRVDVRKLADASCRDLSQADVALLKWVLCSGLYPRVGLPHDKNVERNEKEARFHTKHCRDASLHPTCVLNQKELQPAPGELLGYMEMLETSRVFLCNVVRLPGLPSMVLSSSRIDTNRTMTRLLVDKWLLFTLESEEDSARLLEVATAVRVTVAALVKRRLQRSSHSRAGVGALGELRHTTVLGPEMLAKLPEAVQRIYNIATQGAEGTAGSMTQDQVTHTLLSVLEWGAPYTCEAVPHLAVQSLFCTAPGAAGESDAGAIHVIGQLEDPNERAAAVLKVARSRGLSLARSDKKARLAIDMVIGRCEEAGGAAEAPLDVEAVLAQLEQDFPNPNSSPYGEDGVHVAPWLRYASLREAKASAAPSGEPPKGEQVLGPHMRRHWSCPRCEEELMASYEEIAEHMETCGTELVTPRSSRGLPCAMCHPGARGGCPARCATPELAGAALRDVPPRSSRGLPCAMCHPGARGGSPARCATCMRNSASSEVLSLPRGYLRALPRGYLRALPRLKAAHLLDAARPYCCFIIYPTSCRSLFRLGGCVLRPVTHISPGAVSLVPSPGAVSLASSSGAVSPAPSPGALSLASSPGAVSLTPSPGAVSLAPSPGALSLAPALKPCFDTEHFTDLTGAALTDLTGAALTDLTGAALTDLTGAALTDLTGAALTDLTGAALTDLTGAALLAGICIVSSLPPPAFTIGTNRHAAGACPSVRPPGRCLPECAAAGACPSVRQPVLARVCRRAGACPSVRPPGRCASVRPPVLARVCGRRCLPECSAAGACPSVRPPGRCLPECAAAGPVLARVCGRRCLPECAAAGACPSVRPPVLARVFGRRCLPECAAAGPVEGEDDEAEPITGEPAVEHGQLHVDAATTAPHDAELGGGVESPETSPSPAPKGQQEYRCSECAQIFQFTPIQILLHRRAHAAKASAI